MWELVSTQELVIRFSAFLAVFSVMALWEVAASRRERAFSRWVRWPSNLGIVVLNTGVLRVLFPTATVGVALAAEQAGWGIFNVVGLSGWVEVVLAVVLLDFAIWLQHVLVHFIPVLWRLHRMHHADLDYDVTTGARFHPIEVVISMGLKLMVVSALGAPAVAVVIFEVLLNASAMFNHANVRLASALDRMLRLLIVTPDMHRVHHSVIKKETNSNYGFCLSVWDRMFDTYRDQPEGGHEGMTLGIEQFRTQGDLLLNRMLAQPFRGRTSGGALRER